jgi:branched-chain amino acid transport system substrate-binding protein
MTQPRLTRPLAWRLGIGMALLLTGAGGWWWWLHQPVRVGVDLLLGDGAAWDPTARYAAELYLEDHPQSPIQLVNLFSTLEPASAAPAILQQKRNGVRFFLSSHPSTHLLPSLGEFSRGEALAINTGAVSMRLVGRNDDLLRVAPDLVQEQQAMARTLQRLPGRRVLVLLDQGNPAYASAVLTQFSQALKRLGAWQVVARPITVRTFNPRRDQALMQGKFDALYVVAGTFQPAIGNIAQLFHQQHPQAAILLTPWARSPAIVAHSGPAAQRIWLTSPYPARRQDPSIDAYVRRFHRRYGYNPNALALGTHQAIELLDQALASGARSPAAVKRYLLSKPEHRTSLGPVRFDATGDVQARFHVFPAKADQAP